MVGLSAAAVFAVIVGVAFGAQYGDKNARSTGSMPVASRRTDKQSPIIEIAVS